MASFANQVAALESLATRLMGHLRAHGIEDRYARDVIARLRSEPFRVVVIGEFSRGKSTFVNALVGEKVLPSSVRPTTAVITVIRHGAPRGAIVHFRDEARAAEAVDIPVGSGAKELERVVTTKNAAPEDVARVEITLPLPHLNIPFELVDTPGVNDIDTAREEITYGYLTRADAALMLLDLQQPFSASELRFLQEKVLGNDLRKILFVVNKIDQEPPEKLERALSYVEKKLSEIPACRGARILPVAAKLALAGKQGDPASLASSKMPELESALVEFLVDASGASRLKTASRRLARPAVALMEKLTSMARSLEGEQAALARSVAQFEEDAAIAARRVEALKGDIAVIADSFQVQTTEQVAFALSGLRRALSTITSRPTFPSEDDANEVRRCLNEGLKSIMEIPTRDATLAARTALKRRDYEKGFAAAEHRELQLDLTIETESDTLGLQIGAAIGGAVGWSLLGPLGGLPLTWLGGWLGGMLGARPSGAKIQASVGASLREIEARSREAIAVAAGELKGRLNEELVVPARADGEQRVAALDELRRSASVSHAERQTQASQLLAEAVELRGVVDATLRLGGGQ